MATPSDFAGRQLKESLITKQLFQQSLDHVQRSPITFQPRTGPDHVKEAATLTAKLVAEQGLNAKGKRRRTADAILDGLYFRCEPADEWWTTELGDAVAGALPRESSRRWGYPTAAAYLCVVKGTIGTLVHKGAISTSGMDPDNKHAPTIHPASVVAYRLARDCKV